VGRTDYDTAGAVRAARSMGGGLDPSVERIAAERPDLVIAWPSAGAASMRAAVARLGIPVFVMETRDTAALLAGMRGLARLAGRAPRGEALVRGLRAELAAVRASVPPGARPSAFYVVWTTPPMTAGRRTYVTELLGLAGLRPAFPEATGDWPQLSLEALLARQPDVLVVPRGTDDGRSTLARLRTLEGWQALRALREGRVIEVDAAAMNRPGPGLGAAARQLREGVRRVTGR
jgi:ABC-type Fe3+-hydroxamate transport system substrate-binding protein